MVYACSVSLSEKVGHTVRATLANQEGDVWRDSKPSHKGNNRECGNGEGLEEAVMAASTYLKD